MSIDGSVKLGQSLPPDNPHAVSVSIPTWKATLEWAARESSLVNQLSLGYPRFFVHPFITRLAQSIRKRFDNDSKSLSGLIFPSHQIAQQCVEYILSYEHDDEIHVVDLDIKSDCSNESAKRDAQWLSTHVVFFSPKNWVHGKAFWQHTGKGISSRRAEKCQVLFDDDCYSCTTPNRATNGITNPSEDCISAYASKVAIRERIASLFASGNGSLAVDPSNVFLYPSGMQAITETYHVLLALAQETTRMVAFGFVYVDTFKVLSRLQPRKGEFFGWGNSEDLDKLESQLSQGNNIKALFCEIPSNPLLSSPDLQRIRLMADEYNFLVVCDDTVASPVNVDILSKVDIVVTSLTKLFSGACDVMGGSITLSPYSRYLPALKQQFSRAFIDYYYPEDAIKMEFNSRDFVHRVKVTNKNTLSIADMLSKDPSIEKVYHPSMNSDKAIYDSYKRFDGQYGYLLTILFKEDETAKRFFDVLNVAKGPSLGTNFTLSCPYTLYAHAKELEWAAHYGVTEHIVRISVGVEPLDELMAKIRYALEASRSGDGL